MQTFVVALGSFYGSSKCTALDMGVAAALIRFVVAFNWQTILFAVGIADSEQRPPLLSDAEWGQPDSARKFNRRFSPGTPEAELLAWLDSNGFTVDRTAKIAGRNVGGLPCAERMKVKWEADISGKLQVTNAVISEAGCL